MSAAVIAAAARIAARLRWDRLAVLLADLAAWVGIVALCVLWTRVEAAELPAPGAKCSTVYLGNPASVTVQFLEPGAETDPWAWVTVDVRAGLWYWHRVRTSALQGCRS